MIVTKLFDDLDIEDNVELIENLSKGSLAGNLTKWILKDSKGILWAKGRSREETLEPEAEVCSYELANLFGVEAVKYSLIKIEELDDKPICISRDYSNEKTIVSLYKYLVSINLSEVSKLDGVNKFNLVESILSEKDKVLHRKILLFDYIVGNKDRHLRNFDLRLNRNGEIDSLVEMFDTGASLHSDIYSKKLLKIYCEQSDNYIHSKPYYSTHMKQLTLLKGISLSKVHKKDIYRIINSYFIGERTKLLNKYIIRNVERLGLL